MNKESEYERQIFSLLRADAMSDEEEVYDKDGWPPYKLIHPPAWKKPEVTALLEASNCSPELLSSRLASYNYREGLQAEYAALFEEERTQQ